MTFSREQWIEKLQLQPHVEGGYYRRTFESSHRPVQATPNGSRYAMTSIFYLLSADSPVGHFHRNQSDIMHVFHSGASITYFLIYPDGELQVRTLGSDIDSGEELQFVAPGGVWKASTLNPGHDYGLLSEVVVPGFDFADMTLGQAAILQRRFPQHSELIQRYCKS
ncbi:MAG: cupin domain-containing protein [Candidatus Pelagadaptatus aseana]|uniref:cupin domain-containing protein n=1 Tax=Candidatus Pelagadaptatus aseana TaxID=3120508 RepID=UPI0039B1EB95